MVEKKQLYGMGNAACGTLAPVLAELDSMTHTVILYPSVVRPMACLDIYSNADNHLSFGSTQLRVFSALTCHRVVTSEN